MIFTMTSMICIYKRRGVYDGIHCVADLAPDGTLLRSYTWGSGIDNLLAVTLYGGGATNTLYAVTDPLGTVHALVAADGSVAVSCSYDSWGNLLSADGDETPAAALRFTWQGREYSFATALYNFRARWYDPASGRWLSKDPIGLEGGLNLYEAFGDNPVCFRDPEGLDWFSTWGEAILDGIDAVGNAAAEVCEFGGDVLGKTWGGVNTAVGLVAGGVLGGGFIPGSGVKVSFGNNAIQFENVWFMEWGSITLGNCILYQNGYDGLPQSVQDEISCHEKQHTYQSQVLGPLYFPSHLVFGFTAVFRDREWRGQSNLLERGPYSKPPRPWW